jgi:hypothetical protein
MRMKVETTLACSAEQAWKVLGEGFGDIAKWSCSLAESSLDGEPGFGAVRTCLSARSFGPFEAGIVTEELTEFHPGTRTFAYRATSWSARVHRDRHQSLVDPRSGCRELRRAL